MVKDNEPFLPHPHEMRPQYLIEVRQGKYFSLKYYIRERGAPRGEYVCRVYDIAMAEEICLAMNGQYWGRRILKDLGVRMLTSAHEVETLIAQQEAGDATKH